MLGACRRVVRGAAASPLRAAAMRQLCSGGGSSSARTTVLRLAQEHQAGDNDLDMQRKFDLLTACEAEFGMRMPHTALNRVSTVEDAAQWWEERLVAEEERQAAEAQHYTQASPPNVLILENGRADRDDLRDFIMRHRRRDGFADAEHSNESDGSATPAPPQGDTRVPF